LPALADEALALKKRIDAIKDEAIRRRLKWDHEFESAFLQRGVRSEPRSGRSHLGPGQAVDLVDDQLNTWLTNGDEALQRVWGLVSIDGVAEEWTA
jgi:hypothetical protein